MSETNHTRSHEAIAAMTTPERDGYVCPACGAAQGGQSTNDELYRLRSELEELQREKIAGLRAELKRTARDLGHADATVAELRTALSAMAKQREWISVKERMPPSDVADEYLVVHTVDDLEDGVMRVVTYYPLSVGWNVSEGCVVTHWMPRPAPPHDPTESP